MARKEDFTPNSSVMVGNTRIETFKTQLDVPGCNIIEVETGTTGHMGGDSGHGGRTYFRIEDLACTDMWCRLYNNGKEYEFGNIGLIELMFGGDAELDTFCEALRIGYEVLKNDAYSLPDYQPTTMELRQLRFAQYINELCDSYRKNGSLKGMTAIRSKYHVTGLTQQQFFECDLHRAEGYVPQTFCDEVYAFVLDTTKAVPAPKYNVNK